MVELFGCFQELNCVFEKNLSFTKTPPLFLFDSTQAFKKVDSLNVTHLFFDWWIIAVLWYVYQFMILPLLREEDETPTVSLRLKYEREIHAEALVVPVDARDEELRNAVCHSFIRKAPPTTQLKLKEKVKFEKSDSKKESNSKTKSNSKSQIRKKSQIQNVIQRK